MPTTEYVLSARGMMHRRLAGSPLTACGARFARRLTTPGARTLCARCRALPW